MVFINIDIRQSIKNNFKESNEEEIRTSIEESLKDNDELALPGLGVFFEILWRHSTTDEQNNIVDKIKRNLN